MEDTNNEPCKICGCTEVNLMDGFYYCVECGTQDTNVRETVVEFVALGDGQFGFANKKRVLVPKDPKTQMSDDWYKWHCLNFLLQGLADEVIECGAAPTFKTKLLWVWTQYMKKYQNKADFGLEDNENGNEPEHVKKPKKPREDFDNYSSDEGDEIKLLGRSQFTSIKTINMCLVISLLYVALNLDRSRMQLSHLMRFIIAGRISILSWTKHIPEELRPSRLKFCLLFHRSWFRNSYYTIRELGMELCKELDLGGPLVPDLRALVDDYMQELCLPKEMTSIVHSLMRYRAYEYLDVRAHYHMFKLIPSYELYVMAHILCVIKICFGLDGQYETRLSDAIDKINEMENHPKSYNSQPTERLFSFQEWLKFTLFRQSQLWAHTYLLGAPNFKDVDDYVAAEHQNELPDFSKNLRQEITWNIIYKIPQKKPNVIPRNDFPGTLTPYYTYTRAVIDHIQDPEIKKLLSEDFTQYSIRYFLKDMFLVDPDAENPENLLTGVNRENFWQRHRFFLMREKESFENKLRTHDKKMVYVKDCDNHNWMTTHRPKLEPTKGNKQRDKNASDPASLQSESKNDDDIQSVTTVDINDLTTVNAETNSEEFLSTLNDNINFAKADQIIDMHSVCDDSKQNDYKFETASDIQSVTTVDINEFSTINEIKVDPEESFSLKDNDINEEDSKEFNLNNVSDIQMDTDVDLLEKKEDLKIREEDEGVNIFDENFREFDVKDDIYNEKENVPCEIAPDMNEVPAADNTSFSLPTAMRYDTKRQEYGGGRSDSESSNDSIRVRFTPETLDRNTAIKELVIHACQTHKISIPGKYMIRKKKNYKMIKKFAPGVMRARSLGLINKWIREMIDVYHTKTQQDLFHQMSNAVQAAIANFNQTRTEGDEPMEIDEPAAADNVNNYVENETDIQNIECETGVIADTISDSKIDDVLETEDKYRIFKDDSDGETHAEELLPKKNPEYDEKTHDVSQLYLKPAEEIDIPEIKVNKSVLKIIEEKINEENIDRTSSPEPEEDSDWDPEDNLPLKVIKEMKLIEKSIKGMDPQYDNKNRRLIDEYVTIPSYNYWIKSYLRSDDTPKYKHCAPEMKFMPQSFVTVLKHCSDLLGYSELCLYRSLQRVEQCFKDKVMLRRNNFHPKNIWQKNLAGNASSYSY